MARLVLGSSGMRVFAEHDDGGFRRCRATRRTDRTLRNWRHAARRARDRAIRLGDHNLLWLCDRAIEDVDAAADLLGWTTVVNVHEIGDALPEVFPC